MGVLSLANMLGSFSLGSLSDKFGRKTVIALSAFPAALAAFVVFYWLESAASLAVGILVFGTLKASVPALVVALAQEAAPAGSAGTASGIIMSLHYISGVVAPLIAAQLIIATGNIMLAMILVSSLPLLLYGSLISAVRERSLSYLASNVDEVRFERLERLQQLEPLRVLTAHPPQNAATRARPFRLSSRLRRSWSYAR